MKLLVALLVATVAVAASAPLSEDQYQALFTRFVDEHSKVYESTAEFFKRYNIFKTNQDAIISHQAKADRTFDMAMNEYGDLSNEEFVAKFNRYISLARDNTVPVANLSTVGLPSSVDWPAKGVVTPVKNQGQCGSCWAFSTTGSIESAKAIATGSLVSLSEQELVDCSGSVGNEGCNGGSMPLAFQWVHSNGGLCSEAAYPYQGVDGTCQSSSCTSVTTISGYSSVPANSNSALQAAVAQQPVSVAVDAGGSAWQFYSGGILTSACGTQLDHGVLAAGYGTSGGQDYWLVKNSWGASWGESGYIRLARTSASGPGECGIAMDASYPNY